MTTKKNEPINTIVPMTPQEQAQLDKKMNTPISEIPVTMAMLVSIADLPSIPEAYRGKPKEMMTAIILGREIGIGDMTSINNIDLIEGTVSLRAKLVSALIHRQGHYIRINEQSEERAAFQCFRYHKQTNQLIDVGEVEYTLADAERAKDLNKGTYKKHIRAMLTNRCLTLAARTVFADALMGFAYTLEELGINDEPEPIPLELNMEEASAVVETMLNAEVSDLEDYLPDEDDPVAAHAEVVDA